MVVQACLNGDRMEGVPRSPAELAADAAACVAAGASSIHAHPRDGDGHETLEPTDVAAAVHALRAARVEISLSTGLWITGGDVDARLRAIAGWTERPDLVSMNMSEEGWPELAALLGERGIGIEAGVWTVHEAQVLAESGLVATWSRRGSGPRRHPPVRRILVEPRTENPAEAVQITAEIDAALDAAAVPTARLHHGIGDSVWPVLDAAVKRGRDVRVGFEDGDRLPDGRRAPDNAALVTEAVLRSPLPHRGY